MYTPIFSPSGIFKSADESFHLSICLLDVKSIFPNNCVENLTNEPNSSGVIDKIGHQICAKTSSVTLLASQLAITFDKWTKSQEQK